MGKEEYKEEELKEKTESEISEEFFSEFRNLCRKYNRDFIWNLPEPKIVKVEFPPQPYADNK